jgi:hypothetical protein
MAGNSAFFFEDAKCWDAVADLAHPAHRLRDVLPDAISTYSSMGDGKP